MSAHPFAYAKFFCVATIFFVGMSMSVGIIYALAPSSGAGTSLTLSEVFACQKDAPNDQEWVEIYNASSTEIDLTAWKIGKNKTGTASLSGTLAPNAYKKILFTSGFANDGFAVTLTEPSGTEPIETFPSAFKSDKTTLEKCPSSDLLTSWIKDGENWKLTTTVSADSANTYSALSTPTPTPTLAPTSGSTPSPTANATSTPSPTASPTPGVQPTTVSLSEIYACQADGTKEWVELTNTGSTAVTLTNWKLMDDDNNDQPIPALSIPAKGYAVIEISKYSRGMLTNDGDVVNLYDATGKKVDSYEYSACHADQSWAKNAGSWKETTVITKGLSNPTSVSATASPIASAAAQLEGDGDGSYGEVLGTQSSEESEETPVPSTAPESATSSPLVKIVAILCMGIGIVILGGVGGFLAWEPFLKKRIYTLLRKA